MKVADYVADVLAEISPRVYGVCGAGAMHLNDAIINHPRIKFLAMHHEQAAAMAAEADARVSGKTGIVHCTAGPGGTNTLTGVAGAWVDSIPMLIIAGQVDGRTLIGKDHLRQLGCNELPMTDIMAPVTKWAVTVTNPKMIRYQLGLAAWLAREGRPGPVWVEIPLDVQSADIDVEALPVFEAPEPNVPDLSADCLDVAHLLRLAARPLLLVGNGIHLAGAEQEFSEFRLNWMLPVCTSWNAIDLVCSDNPLFVGRPGLVGDRAGNFAVANADLIIAIGTRLSIPQIGHATKLFARDAKLVMVDIDPAEMSKSTLSVDLPIDADAKQFLAQMNKIEPRLTSPSWCAQCWVWKDRYPVIQPEYESETQGINAYHFMDVLSEVLPDDAIVVTDVGTPFQAAMQSLRLRGGQRLFHSGGVSAMGYGIPAAIGAHMAGGRPVIGLVGDGGAMVNVQELQTIAFNQLPIKIFVFANDGYSTMRFTQQTHFKREAASSPASGLGVPSFAEVASAFGIKALHYHKQDNLKDALRDILELQTPFLAELEMPVSQVLAPRVQSRMENGKFVPVPMEEMWPYLPHEEQVMNMLMSKAANTRAA